MKTQVRIERKGALLTLSLALAMSVALIATGCGGGDDDNENDAVPVTSVSITNKAAVAEITTGESVTLTISITPTNASNKSVTWTSSDSGKATVDQDGKVTGVAIGKATITVTTNDGSNKSDTVDVEVIAANTAAIATVSITGELAKGVTLTATAKDASGATVTDAEYKWYRFTEIPTTAAITSTLSAIGTSKTYTLGEDDVDNYIAVLADNAATTDPGKYAVSSGTVAGEPAPAVVYTTAVAFSLTTPEADDSNTISNPSSLTAGAGNVAVSVENGTESVVIEYTTGPAQTLALTDAADGVTVTAGAITVDTTSISGLPGGVIEFSVEVSDSAEGITSITYNFTVTAAEDEDYVTAKAAALALASELGEGAEADYTTPEDIKVVVTGEVTPGAITVPADVTLEVAEDGKIIVTDSAIALDGGTVVIEGTVEHAKANAWGAFTGDGTVVIEAGGVLDQGSNWGFGGSDFEFELGGDARVTATFAAGQVSLEFEGSITANGAGISTTAYLSKNTTVKGTLSVAESATLSVAESATLSVAGSATLSVAGTVTLVDGTSTLELTPGAKLAATATGKIYAGGTTSAATLTATLTDTETANVNALVSASGTDFTISGDETGAAAKAIIGNLGITGNTSGLVLTVSDETPAGGSLTTGSTATLVIAGPSA